MTLKKIYPPFYSHSVSVSVQCELMLKVFLVEDSELSASGFLSNGANICTLRLKNSKMNGEGLHYSIVTSVITEGLGEPDIL